MFIVTFFKNLPIFPGFKIPDIYFGIGCLRQGGTIKGNTIIIGAELAAADTLIDKSELSTWLKSVVGKTGDIVAMTAHESIHVEGHIPEFRH